MVKHLLIFGAVLTSMTLPFSSEAKVDWRLTPFQSPSAEKLVKHQFDSFSKEIGYNNPQTPFKVSDDDRGWGDEDYLTVTCEFLYEAPAYRPVTLYALGGNGEVNHYSGTFNPDLLSASISLPAGTYDFFVEFTPMLEDAPWLEIEGLEPFQIPDPYKPSKFIIKENVEISQEQTLNFNIEDSTKGFIFMPIDNKKQTFKVPLLTVVNGEIKWDYSSCNADDVFFATVFYNNEMGAYIAGFVSDYANCLEDGRTGATHGNLFLNDVSDRYTIYQFVIAYDTNSEELWSENLATGAQNSFMKVIMPRVDNFKRLKQEFDPTPASGQYERESAYTIQFNWLINDRGLTGSQFMFDNSPNINFQNYSYDYTGDFLASTVFIPQENAICVFDTDWGLWTMYGIQGCPITLRDGELWYENPLNPYYSDTAVNNHWIMGMGNPVTFISGANYAVPSFGSTAVPLPEMVWSAQVNGQYGENFTIDVPLMEFEGSVDGEVLCTELSNLNQWSRSLAKDGHTPGEVALSFTNSNIRIDGMDAINETEVIYNETNKDACPPTLQMIRFTNLESQTSGSVFVDKDIMLEFSAADINTSRFYGTTYEEATIKVEYAPHATTEYIELTVEQITGLDGNILPVYAVNLNQMDDQVKSEGGWFDFRFTITDNAGNKMIQTMKPALRIETLDSDSSVGLTRIDEGPEVYYDLFGRKISTPISNQILLKKTSSGFRKVIIR